MIGKTKGKFQRALEKIQSLFLEQFQMMRDQTETTTEWKLETILDSDGEFLKYEYLFIFNRKIELKKIHFLSTKQIVEQLKSVSEEDYYILLTGKLKHDIHEILSIYKNIQKQLLVHNVTTTVNELDESYQNFVNELNLFFNKQLLEFLKSNGLYLWGNYLEDKTFSKDNRFVISSNFLSEQNLENLLRVSSHSDNILHSRAVGALNHQARSKEHDNNLNYYKLWFKFTPYLKQVQEKLLLELLQNEDSCSDLNVAYFWWKNWAVVDKYKFLKQYFENLSETNNVTVTFFNLFMRDNNFLEEIKNDYLGLIEHPETVSEVERKLILQILVEIFLILLRLDASDYQYRIGELRHFSIKEYNWLGWIEKLFWNELKSENKFLLPFLEERLNKQSMTFIISPDKLVAFEVILTTPTETNYNLLYLIESIVKQLKINKKFVTIKLDLIYKYFIDFDPSYSIFDSHFYQFNEMVKFINHKRTCDSLTVTFTEKERQLFRNHFDNQNLTDFEILEKLND